MFFKAIAGLLCFIMGIELLSKGVYVIGKNKAQMLISAATGSFTRAVSSGVIITAISQSSSLTTVIVIELMQIKALKLREAMAVVIGANIGTCVTAQIIAFNINQLGKWMLVLTPVFAIMIYKDNKKFTLFPIYLGLALTLFGLDIISFAFTPLLTGWGNGIMLEAATSSTPAGIAVGAGFTALMQSSSAVIAIVQSAITSGIIELKPALALTAGANIGTCVTAMLAAYRSNPDGKRLALWHLYFNAFGSIIFLMFTSLFVKGAGFFAASPARQIANGHLLFNLAAGCLAAPFIPFFHRIIQKRCCHGL